MILIFQLYTTEWLKLLIVLCGLYNKDIYIYIPILFYILPQQTIKKGATLLVNTLTIGTGGEEKTIAAWKYDQSKEWKVENKQKGERKRRRKRWGYIYSYSVRYLAKAGNIS